MKTLRSYAPPPLENEEEEEEDEEEEEEEEKEEKGNKRYCIGKFASSHLESYIFPRH